jgi:ATP-dependent helicase YprA (DUF1998 family)
MPCRGDRPPEKQSNKLKRLTSNPRTTRPTLRIIEGKPSRSLPRRRFKLECVCDERCKEMNVVMSKAGAGVILRCLLGWEVDVSMRATARRRSNPINSNALLAIPEPHDPPFAS